MAKQEKTLSIFSICEYYNRIFCFKLNPDMTTFLPQLKEEFSKPLFKDFMKMKSPYSIAIWDLIQKEIYSRKLSLTNTIQFNLTLDELREITGTTKKLTQLGQFKERCFDKALREINKNCGVKVTYENIKKSRTVVGFRCSAVFVRTPQQDLYLSKEQVMKDKNIYSYILRFNKKLARDRQALEKIIQFCNLTDMTMREAILFVLATVDTSALYESISSLTVAREKL